MEFEGMEKKKKYERSN